MSLGVISPIRNKGLYSDWLSAAPLATSMLTIDTSGNVGSQAIPVAAWGSITGTLSSQTDLQNALDAKLSLSGGTMTGALSGTSATFSSTVTIPAITGSSNLIYVAQNQTFSWEYDSTNTNPALRFTWGGAATTLWGSSSAVNISVQGTNGFRVAAGTTNLAGTLGLGSVSSPTAFLRSDGSNTIDIRNSTNAQRLNLYGTYTDASNYRRLYLSSTTAGAFTLGVEGAGTGASGNTLTVANATTFSSTVTFIGGDYFTPSCYLGSNIRLYGPSNFTVAILGENCSSLDQSNFKFRQQVGLGWSSTSDATASADVYLRRNTAGQLDVRGDSGLRVRNLANTADAAITASTGTFSSYVYTTADAAATLPLRIRGAASQSANLTEWQSSTGGVWIRVTSNGTIRSATGDQYTPTISNASWGPGHGIIVNGTASCAFAQNNDVVAQVNGSSGVFEFFRQMQVYVQGTGTFATITADTSDTLALRRSTNAQTLRIYGTYTDASNYRRLYLSSTTAGAFTLGVEGAGTGASGNTLTVGNNVSGPIAVSQSWTISAGIPPQQANSVAGNDLNLYATDAVVAASGNTGANGGNILIRAGNANRVGIGTSPIGGSVTITGGTGVAGGASGNVTIQGATGSSATNAGHVYIKGGECTTYNNDLLHGSVFISTFSGVGYTHPGNIISTVGGGTDNSNPGQAAGAAGYYSISLGTGGTGSFGSGVKTGGAGGYFTLTGGSGGAVTSSTANTSIGGNGGSLTFTSGAGGNATAGVGTRTGGNSGDIIFNIGTVGTGSTANGSFGSLIWQQGGSERLRLTPTGLLSFGGTTSSFPAIKRNAAAINFRLADDSGDAEITSSKLTVSDRVILSTSANLWLRGTGSGIVMSYYNSELFRFGHGQIVIDLNGQGTLTFGSQTNISCVNGGLTYVQAGNISQVWRIANTFTDQSNFRALSLQWSSYSSVNYGLISIVAAGTGIQNSPLVLTPGGTGAFIVGPMPDGTATGGNARGNYAIDVQSSLRSNANQIASGLYSVAIGSRNISSGEDTIAIGLDNSSIRYDSVAIGKVNSADYGGVSIGWANASNFGGVALGQGNSATGEQAVSLGGSNSAPANYSTAIGKSNAASATNSIALGNSASSNRFGMFSHACGLFASGGDSQYARFVLRRKTTDNTATTLMLDGSSTRLTIPSGKVFMFEAKIVGVKSDGTAAATYYRKGCIENVGGTTALVGTIETIGTDYEDNAATDIAITADNTNDALQINVIGITAETWRWVAVVEGVEVAYGT
jgi:hypothetical protein